MHSWHRRCVDEVPRRSGAAPGVRGRRAQCGGPRARSAACPRGRQPAAEPGSARGEPKAARAVRLVTYDGGKVGRIEGEEIVRLDVPTMRYWFEVGGAEDAGER